MEYARAYIPDQEFTGLVDLKTAFLRGSAFNNLYQPYKEFNYQLPATNMELKNIQAIGFVLHDLTLFLDTHPNNRRALNMYSEYNQKFKELVDNYERKYGPLTLRSNVLGEYPWSWINEPWPWEVGI